MHPGLIALLVCLCTVVVGLSLTAVVCLNNSTYNI